MRRELLSEATDALAWIGSSGAGASLLATEGGCGGASKKGEITVFSAYDAAQNFGEKEGVSSGSGISRRPHRSMKTVKSEKNSNGSTSPDGSFTSSCQNQALQGT